MSEPAQRIAAEYWPAGNRDLGRPPPSPDDCKNEPWYIRCKGPLIVFALVIAAIFVKWLYLRYAWGKDNVAAHDPMNVKVVNIPCLENCCSWWPISHFILFFVVGYFWPECWWQAILLGALWELFEVVMSYITQKERQGARDPRSGEIEYSSNWWAGSFKDVLMNILGVLIGVSVRRLVEKALDERRDACGRTFALAS